MQNMEGGAKTEAVLGGVACFHSVACALCCRYHHGAADRQDGQEEWISSHAKVRTTWELRGALV